MTLTMRVLLLVVALLPACTALAEDLRARDGTVYHRAKVVQIDPDGLIVEYDKGIAKIDFQKLSPEMQRQFGFDKRKADAYRAQETQVVQENQRIVKEHEQHELERIRKMMESGASGDELIYHAGPTQGNSARIVRQIEREMTAREEAILAAEREPRTFWNAPFWQSPAVEFLGALLGGARSREGRINDGAGSDMFSRYLSEVVYGCEGPINNGVGFDNHRGFSH
jgi:hypothetical protein